MNLKCDILDVNINDLKIDKDCYEFYCYFYKYVGSLRLCFRWFLIGGLGFVSFMF